MLQMGMTITQKILAAHAGLPEVKAGQRNSKKDADAIREAITLLQGVLGELEDTSEEAPEGEDEAKANTAVEEPEQSNPRKDALLEIINKLMNEEEIS